MKLLIDTLSHSPGTNLNNQKILEKLNQCCIIKVRFFEQRLGKNKG